MIQLTADEGRVLGVLIEKAQTTPEQYPLSLNAITNGSNQKNNRDPVLVMTEEQAFDAVEGLRRHGLVLRVDTLGSRVPKFRHLVTDLLKVRTGELVVLAELLLRGPSTLGELRGRASRMHPLETLDVVKDMLRALMERPEPMARELPPSPGSRAERYEQLLCLESYDDGESQPVEPSPVVPVSVAAPAPMDSALQDRVTALEGEVARLGAAVSRLAMSLGEVDPLAGEGVPASG